MPLARIGRGGARNLGYVHLGVPNVDASTSGLIDGAGPHTLTGGVGDTSPRILNFVRTGANIIIPEDMTFDDSGADKGKFVLPRGHWIICTSIHIDVTSAGNDRVTAEMGIYHGANLRHAQSCYFRNHQHLTVGEGYISVAGAVVSDGATKGYVGVILDVETAGDEITFRGAHFHAYQQDVPSVGTTKTTYTIQRQAVDIAALGTVGTPMLLANKGDRDIYVTEHALIGGVSPNVLRGAPFNDQAVYEPDGTPIWVYTRGGSAQLEVSQ